MTQIKNGFADYFYIDTNGKVYNSKTKKYLKLSNNSYELRNEEGKQKKISLKKLYYLVYKKVFCIDDIEDLKGEIWKPIPGTNNTYFASNFARIKSYAHYKASILKQRFDNKGYARVDIVQNGKSKTKLVHTLVATTFLDNPPSGEFQVHHKDFNPMNNLLNNLCFVSSDEHIKIHNRKGEN